MQKSLIMQKIENKLNFWEGKSILRVWIDFFYFLWDKKFKWDQIKFSLHISIKSVVKIIQTQTEDFYLPWQI
jgi:hypothetical protein